ncbi:hypothetical protein BaRGS_00005611, partial [Batillaria attramentaria]
HVQTPGWDMGQKYPEYMDSCVNITAQEDVGVLAKITIEKAHRHEGRDPRYNHTTCREQRSGKPPNGLRTLARCYPRALVSNADLQKLCEMSEKLTKVNVAVEELRSETFESIGAAHRVGQRPQSHRGQQQQQRKPRPIIVRFVNRKAADTVLQNRRMLKRTPFVITEDLTRANFALLNYCWVHPDVDDAWSKRGNIFVKRGTRIRKIESRSDLPDCPLDSSTPHMQRRRRQRDPQSGQDPHADNNNTGPKSQCCGYYGRSKQHPGQYD